MRDESAISNNHETTLEQLMRRLDNICTLFGNKLQEVTNGQTETRMILESALLRIQELEFRLGNMNQNPPSQTTPPVGRDNTSTSSMVGKGIKASKHAVLGTEKIVTKPTAPFAAVAVKAPTKQPPTNHVASNASFRSIKQHVSSLRPPQRRDTNFCTSIKRADFP